MYMNKINIFITFASTVFLSACATYTPQYLESNNSPQKTTTNKEIENSFILLGDGGFVKKHTLDALPSVQKYLKDKTDKSSYALFLGNSFVPNGMPIKDKKSQTIATNNMLKQWDALTEFKGKTIVLPGYLDWKGGVDGLELEEDLLKKLAKDKDILLPNNGCPMESVNVGKDIQLILLDSQWYIENWDNIPRMNDKCEIRTREKMFISIGDELKKNFDKTIIFAMHHPLISNGSYGGKYPAFDPIIANNLIRQFKTQGAISKQDRYNERYDELMQRLKILVKDNPKIIFVSGHDQSLQYSKEGNIHQIVSASTATSTAASLGQFGQFSYGGTGFAVLNVYKDGSSGVSFIKTEEDGGSEILFQKEIINPDKKPDPSKFPSSYPKTVQAKVYDDSLTQKTGFYKTIWGNHYRKVYGTNVTAPVALLDTLYGGLKVIRAGGGHQTRSLRLEDKDGKPYNMRALKKSAVQFLQNVLIKDKSVEDEFKNTLPEDLILDFYTAAHPYGAFTIPELSEAAGIFHTNPKLYYIPKQKALGKYNEEYGDALYMIVEKPDKEFDGKIFDYAKDIDGTDGLLEKLREDEENRVDEKAYIRARVFDMLVGDWDRHADQWTWAEYDKDGNKTFVPIPRDRDQVYANFDGGLPDVIRSLFNTSQQFQVYGPELKHTKWFNSAGIKLDRALIENYGKEEWLAQALFIKDHVTDAVIESAFKNLPKEVNDETAADIKSKLKGRKENIVKISGEYYDYLAKLQTVTGTDKDDYFEITRLPKGITSIKSFRIKDGKKANLMTERNFDSKETCEIWVYGLDDDDVFEVTGKGDHPIFIRIIGGQNNDVYKIANGRNIKVYDNKNQKNTIEKKGGAAFRLTDNYNFNTYNYLKQIQSSNLLLPSVGYNPDDGFKIGISDLFTVKGFQENPFAQQHRLNAGYYFETQSFDINYEGEFANIFSDWNFIMAGYYKNPNFSENFFGFGNETINPEYEFSDIFDMDYNRVRIGGYGGSVGIQKDSHYGSFFRFEAKFDGIKVEDTKGRFISLNRPTELDKTKYFVTVEGIYGYESFDNKINPTRGMDFKLKTGGTQNVEDSNAIFGYVKPNIIFYNALSKNRKLVLKTDVQGQLNLGNNFEFYQAAKLGSDTGLRGYRNERFSGRTSAVAGADIRYSFNKFHTGLTPIQLGIFAGSDIGRVWVPNDTSDVWHNDYGGGFWVNAADLLGGTFNLFTGDEGLRFTFGLSLSM